ncbi:hypothetical protein GOC74_02790 [Halomicrobium mukohataei]|uniref:Uncharacterized protein n=1 Tax=Halomicrobium mukohataei TaxID=57705 RepID=A0A847UBM8_9EURY|nr:DUF5810 domain-containing protein [Halomicrobium mukohataei]NLV08860.1 hypothetical protein [Halomicrobium mukohataei]
MGYACPVCEEPQADAGHLANHLAFTALTGGGDHEDWLDEHVPDWGDHGEDELAAEVVELAAETEFPFEAGGHDHQHGQGHGIDPQQARERASGELDDEAAEILEEAREMTEAMQEADAERSESADETE